MTRELHNAIMKRPKLRNKILRNKSLTNRKKCKIQRNICKKMRESKKVYFSSLNTNKITDVRTFWRRVVPLFTKKASRSDKFINTGGGKNISDGKELCQTFNNFFSNAVSYWKIHNL